MSPSRWGAAVHPGLEEKLVGLKPEEEKEIEVSFPEDYGYKKWAGKTISFHVKIKEIKEKSFPLWTTSLPRTWEIIASSRS